MAAWIKKFETLGLILLAVLCLADVYFWQLIFKTRPISDPRDHILESNGHKDVLIVLKGGVQIMVDAGRGDWDKVANDPAVPIPAYIDLAIIGNADINSFGGFEAMLTHTSFGAIIFNGREPYSSAWLDLRNTIDDKHIPLITVGAGDRLTYNGNDIDFLSPNHEFARSPDPMDAGLAFLAVTPAFRTLFVGDIGANVEHYLTANRRGLSANVVVRPSAKTSPTGTSTMTIFEMQNGKLHMRYNEVE